MAGRKLESKFQAELKKELRRRYPGCIVMKNDPEGIQGIPDLTILYSERWATLECKQYEKARRRPNQDYYVEKLDQMGFSRFIFPENRDAVLQELDGWFRV